MESNISCNQFVAVFGSLEAILYVNIITLIIITCFWSFVILYSLCLINGKTKSRKVSVSLPPPPRHSVSSISGLNNVVRKLSSQRSSQAAGYLTIPNQNIVSDSEAIEYQGKVEDTFFRFEGSDTNDIIINEVVIN